MTAPIDAVSGLVSRLRQRAMAILAVRKIPTPIQRHDAALDHEAADALEAQASELAEATRLRRVAEALSVRNDDAFDELQSKFATAQTRIAALEDAVRVKDEALAGLVNARALKGVREQVAGWNGEGRDDGPYPRHDPRLGATLPKTNCGAVYELDEAMTRARTALSNGEPHDR